MRDEKAPFDIDVALRDVEAAIAPYPPAMLFELARDGYNSPFEQLVACMISIRTLDEVAGAAARRLFSRARQPATVAVLSPAEIEALIRPASFAASKAGQIHALARRVAEEYAGALPCDETIMRSFSGVGPKCANLALGIACGQARIGVDVHVHRVCNRWGYISAPTAEASMAALEAKLPQRYWVAINRVLVPFGKHICTGRLPRCSHCPVRPMCRQVGVERHR